MQHLRPSLATVGHYDLCLFLSGSFTQVCRLKIGERYFYFVRLFTSQSTIFQLCRDGSTWVEPVLSKDKCVFAHEHNTVTPMRLQPAAPPSRVKYSINVLPWRKISTLFSKEI